MTLIFVVKVWLFVLQVHPSENITLHCTTPQYPHTPKSVNQNSQFYRKWADTIKYIIFTVLVFGSVKRNIDSSTGEWHHLTTIKAQIHPYQVGLPAQLPSFTTFVSFFTFDPQTLETLLISAFLFGPNISVKVILIYVHVANRDSYTLALLPRFPGVKKTNLQLSLLCPLYSTARWPVIITSLKQTWIG